MPAAWRYSPRSGRFIFGEARPALSTAKSRSAAAKKRVQIVRASVVRVSVAGYVFAIAGYALPLDALLPID
jgi:hypothetical protein